MRRSRGRGDLALRVAVTELPREGIDLVIRPHATECADLAARLGVESITGLEADITLRPWRRDGAFAEGRLRARIGQICVVSLEPLETDLDLEIREAFRPGGDETEVVIDPNNMDDAESLTGSEIDVGALVADTLATAIEPYPRKPDAVLELGQQGSDSPEPVEPASSPFADLADLARGRRDD